MRGCACRDYNSAPGGLTALPAADSSRRLDSRLSYAFVSSQF
ncbi:Uncharacterized protein ChrSV_4447 [Chromobacterium vaccinii]|nr:Uncharacterized protein ChrSW_4447 [Chromobacterium vaccinii]QND91903.1 Uncharacterized protein ChrSV_4447 [Chromobacterium vaccinii]